LAVAGLRIGLYENWIGFNPATGQADFVTQLLWTFFRLNLLLGTFNLLPAPPLDGSTVIMLFMSEKTAQKYLDWLRENSFAMVGLLLALLLFRRIYPYVLAFATEHLLKGYA
ncbi:MAG TPA: site-2 protease family protein, partial [Candidatus Dormibacteraeota bacterium]|nr:site-2 protease family protein [Candidatus Dormibacteraeota bacterium]